MNSTFKTRVNDTFDFSLQKDEIVAMDALSRDGAVHIVHNNQSIMVSVEKRDFEKRSYYLKIDGTLYEVIIENELDLLIAEMGLATGEENVSNEVHAPMPGLIIEVAVTEGQEVKEGEVLCVLEAMKMENALLSPKDGTVKFVTVKRGDTVEKGALLIDFEQE